jgi:dihydrofolate synthase/folylpolyglutamate synthase
VNKLKPVIKKAQKTDLGAPSAFELFFAIALLYFKDMKCEWVVLEVGLGGRYDATNVIEKPQVTAITTIDYDHTEILGKTLEKIAYDKAGIIKKGSVFFTTENRANLVNMFKKICKEQKAEFIAWPKRRSYKERNVLLASAIASACGVGTADIKKGIEATRMPCRFEMIQDEPMVILDGAHNRAKMRTTVKNLSELEYEKLTLIFAIANTKKDNAAVLEQIIPKADRIVIAGTEEADRKSIHPSVLEPLVKKYKRQSAKIEIIENPKQAIEQALKDAGQKDCILVTGSFFLAGEVRKHWYPARYVLTNRKSF